MHIQYQQTFDTFCQEKSLMESSRSCYCFYQNIWKYEEVMHFQNFVCGFGSDLTFHFQPCFELLCSVCNFPSIPDTRGFESPNRWSLNRLNLTWTVKNFCLNSNQRTIRDKGNWANFIKHSDWVIGFRNDQQKWRLTDARPPIAFPTFFTSTSKWTFCFGTISVAVTIMSVFSALIKIWKKRWFSDIDQKQ